VDIFGNLIFRKLKSPPDLDQKNSDSIIDLVWREQFSKGNIWQWRCFIFSLYVQVKS